MKKYVFLMMFLFATSLYAEWPAKMRIWVNNMSIDSGQVNIFIEELSVVLSKCPHSKIMLFTNHFKGYNKTWGDMVINFKGTCQNQTLAISSIICFTDKEGQLILAQDPFINLFKWEDKNDVKESLCKSIIKELDKIKEIVEKPYDN